MISISTTKTLSPNGEVLAGQIVESTYNDDSLIILEITKSLNGEEASVTTYEYSKNNLLIKEETTHEGTLIMKRTFQYSALEELISEKLFDDSKKMIYQIERRGNKIVENEYDHYSKPTLKLTKHLDLQDQVIKEIDDIGNVTEYEYQGNNLVNCKMYEAGILVMNEDYFFDEHNNETKSEGVELDIQEKITVIKEYNQANKLVKENQFLNDLPVFERILEYNDKNQLIKSTSTDKQNGESELVTVTYQD